MIDLDKAAQDAIDGKITRAEYYRLWRQWLDEVLPEGEEE